MHCGRSMSNQLSEAKFKPSVTRTYEVSRSETCLMQDEYEGGGTGSDGRLSQTPSHSLLVHHMLEL